MKNGGQTTDCGCGSTYAEGGFVEDNSPLEVGDVVYVIDNSKPRNEWLRGVYVSKQGKDANVVITDADANQFEKTISFDKLIKLDIAQANPSDFKLFNQEFSKAKDNYFLADPFIASLGAVTDNFPALDSLITRAKTEPREEIETPIGVDPQYLAEAGAQVSVVTKLSTGIGAHIRLSRHLDPIYFHANTEVQTSYGVVSVSCESIVMPMRI
jgi:hypothetical protein